MALSQHSMGFTMVLVMTIVIGGCESAGDDGGGPSMDELASQVSAQRAIQQTQQAKAAEQEAAQAAVQAAPQASPEPQRRVAERPDAGQGGYYTAIVGARRHVLNRVEDLAWLQGVQHFKAEHGRLPKDHAEFMSKVVEPLGIDLGYKQENEEFLYDPSIGQWGEVYVVEKLDETGQK